MIILSPLILGGFLAVSLLHVVAKTFGSEKKWAHFPTFSVALEQEGNKRRFYAALCPNAALRHLVLQTAGSELCIIV